MTKYRFAGLSNRFDNYHDYDFNTDNPNEYWVLTYVEGKRRWYAMSHISDDNQSMFEEGREGTREEIAKLLEAMPVNALPAEAYLYGFCQ